MSDNKFDATITSLFKGMDGFLTAKTVVGEPVTINDTIILPLVDVSFGVAAGANAKAKDNKNAAAGGLGGKMSPCAILVIHDGITRLVNVKNQDTMTKILDMIPDVIDKVISVITNKTDPEVEEAVEAMVNEAE